MAKTIKMKKVAKAIAEACNVNVIEARELVPIFVRKAA